MQSHPSNFLVLESYSTLLILGRFIDLESKASNKSEDEEKRHEC